MRFLYFFLPLLFLAACQSNPVAPTKGPVPAQLSASADPLVKGQTFTWGGSVISIRNLQDHTLLEVMAYPLDTEGRPRTDLKSQGRFLAHYDGFLEPAEYPVGRLVTVTGPMLGYKDGKVGQADYRYPVLRADQIRSWQQRSSSSWNSRPAVSVGVGVGGGSGGGGWSNIGIGIGF